METNIPQSFDDIEAELPTRTASFDFAQAWAQNAQKVHAENDELRAQIKRLRRWKIYFWGLIFLEIVVISLYFLKKIGS